MRGFVAGHQQFRGEEEVYSRRSGDRRQRRVFRDAAIEGAQVRFDDSVRLLFESPRNGVTRGSSGRP